MNNYRLLRQGIVLFVLGILLAPHAWAQDALPNQDVTTGIDSVKVFFDGAQIYRHVSVTVPAGQSTVTFKGLSQHVNDASVQPGIARGPRVTSSSVRYSYLNKDNYGKEIQNLLDSIVLVDDTYARIVAKERGLETERDLLEENNKLGGEQGDFTTEDLERAAVFYRKRFEQINYDLYRFSIEKRELNMAKNRLNNALSEFNSQRNVPTKDVVVTIESPRSGKINVSLQYVVGESGWGARYDIRSESVDEDVHITYLADVYNATGIE